jgi:hypothetical protein
MSAMTLAKEVRSRADEADAAAQSADASIGLLVLHQDAQRFVHDVDLALEPRELLGSEHEIITEIDDGSHDIWLADSDIDVKGALLTAPRAASAA